MDATRKLPRWPSIQDLLIRVYLWLLILTLPIDWFGPTGTLLREGGAKPAIPLMVLASLITFLAWPQRFSRHIPLASLRVLSAFALIFVCGLLAFSINLIMGWSRFDASKTPLTQFITQAALFLLTPALIAAHAEILRDRHWSSYAIGLIPWAAAIHLSVAGLELAGVFHYDRLPLSLFRTGYETNSMRLSGMTSEPSYFGTLAALYALPLVLAFPGKRRWLYRTLAALLLILALAAGGKTVLPVGLCGLLAYAWYARLRIYRLRNLFIAVLVAAFAIVFLARTSPFDVRENLSSAMRFGSTLTSINVALAGYGITGVGFGQFHFMFLERFMPRFLLFSPEALSQMASTADHRTSTFNLFTRYWVETGITGLALFLAVLAYLFRLARRTPSQPALIGILMLGSSLGFLLTQEPYCYPPLILAASLILAAQHDRSSSLNGASPP
jgi:O-antigen ligase